MSSRALLACLCIAAFALTGCASPTPPEIAGPSPSPSGSPSAEPPTEPTAKPAVSCTTIVTQQTLDGFEAEGFMLEPDYESEVRAEGGVEELFFDFGGVSCRWLQPGSEGWFIAAYSTLTEEQAAEAQARLAAEGFVSTADGLDVLFSTGEQADTLGQSDTFLFEPDAWYHSNHPGGVEEIRAVVTAER